MRDGRLREFLLLAAALLLFAWAQSAAASIVPATGVEAGPAISTSSTHDFLPLIRGWFIGPVSVNYDPDFAWLKELQAPDRGW